MNDRDVRITIALLPFGSEDWREQQMTPEEYFDLDPGEIPEFDSVPDYAHAIEYFPDVPRESIMATKIVVFDPSKNNTCTITEVFWNAGKNRVIERQDRLGDEDSDWEMILDIQVGNDLSKSELLRLRRPGGLLKVISHYSYSRQPDGSEIEQRVSDR